MAVTTMKSSQAKEEVKTLNFDEIFDIPQLALPHDLQTVRGLMCCALLKSLIFFAIYKTLTF